MSFYIDLSSISLEEYKEQLNTDPLVKSRMLLRDSIEEHFAKLSEQGIETVEHLYEACKTKSRLLKLIKATAIDENYCTVLAREVKTLRSAPVKIKDFPVGDIDCSDTFDQNGIKDAKQLYDRTRSEHDTAQLAELCNVKQNTVKIYAQLCDITRIRYVNHTFAVLLHHAGYTSALNVAEADPQSMYDDVNTANEKLQLFSNRIGLSDMEFCIHYAGKLD